jgi:type I restriction enzyme M protein
MLFIKYISDVWRDHYDTYRQQYGDDEERIQRRMQRERFVLPPDCDFAALYRQHKADNIGEIINIALDEIEHANRTKLEGVFRNIDFNPSRSTSGARMARRTTASAASIAGCRPRARAIMRSSRI